MFVYDSSTTRLNLQIYCRLCQTTDIYKVLLGHKSKVPIRLCICMPFTCKETFTNHINSVYVGSIVRIYGPNISPTAHWITDEGVFATLDDASKSDYVRLKYKTWVVNQRYIRPGSF